MEPWCNYVTNPEVVLLTIACICNKLNWRSEDLHRILHVTVRVVCTRVWTGKLILKKIKSKIVRRAADPMPIDVMDSQLANQHNHGAGLNIC